MSNQKDVLTSRTTTFQTVKPQNERWPYFNPVELIPSACEVSFIPTENGIPQPDKAYTRVAKYLPGMKSIWKDEWSDLDQVKKPAKLKLDYGFMAVDTRNKNLLDYMRLAGYNAANTETNINSAVLWKEVNYEYSAKEVIIETRNKDAARNFVLNAPINDVRAVALSLAKTKSRITEIHNQDEYTLRSSLLGTAQESPDAFTGNLKDGVSKNKLFIIKALQSKIIDVDEEEGCILWSKNNEVIVDAATGTDPIDYFSELAVSNDKYKGLLSSIKELLNVSTDKSEKAKEEKPKDITDMLIDLALSKGILTESGNWLIIPGKEDGDKPLFKIQGRRKLKVAIADNEDGVRDLLSEVYK